MRRDGKDGVAISMPYAGIIRIVPDIAADIAFLQGQGRRPPKPMRRKRKRWRHSKRQRLRSANLFL
eukprot:8662792-Lingulodinium_polyedra.AAC.1